MKEQSTGKGFAILSLAGLVSKVLSVLYIPMLTAIIGVEGLGVYQKTYDVFTFVYAVTSMGLQVAVAKLVSELSAMGNYKDALRSFKLARSIMFGVGLVATLMMMGFAKTIATATSNPRITFGIIALAPTIVITTVLVSYRGYFQANNLMTKLAVSQVLEQIINVVFSLGCAAILIKSSIDLGAAGGTVGTSLGALIALFYLMFIFRINKLDKVTVDKQDPKAKRWSNKKIIKRLCMYGFPIALSSGLQYFGALVDMFNVNARLLVAGYTMSQADISYGLLGEYKTILYVPMIIITSLGTVVLPAISRALAVRDRHTVRKKIIYALKLTLMVSIPAAIGMSTLSNEIYITLFGSSNGSELMVWGAIVVIFMALVQIQSTMLQSINQFYFVVMTLVIGILAKLAANYYLIGIPEINIMGAVVGGYLCFVIPALMNNIKIKKTLRIKFSLIQIGMKPAIASAVMGAVIVGSKLLVSNFIPLEGRLIITVLTAVLAIIGVIVYGVTMILIGGVTKADIEGISPKIISILPGFLRRALR